jgi:predicted CopG family antitoxin
MKNIIIEVNDDAAERFIKMSPSEKRAVSKEFSRFLTRKRNIFEIMDDISKQAKENGLTPEILEELLKDE